MQDIGEYYEKTYKDVLTGAFNRRFYEEKLRLYPLDGGIAMIDVDDFKIYNDLFGHNVGDAVLCAVAEALKEHVRNNDFLIRYGGDEFFARASPQRKRRVRCGNEKNRAKNARRRGERF